MKETLYKYETRLYNTIFHENFSKLEDEKKNKKLEEDLLFSLDVVEDYNESKVYQTKRKNEKPIFFTYKKTSSCEDDFVENFGNTLCAVSKRTFILVVEVENNKVTFKRFSNIMFRKVGKSYFQRSSRVDYISFNKETKFIYQGHILDYHKKRKCVKSVRKNFFAKGILNSFLIELKNQLRNFDKKDESGDIIFESVNIFTRACGLKPDIINSWDDLFYRDYLDKMGIKYPNNFSAYRTVRFESQPKLKEIRKAKMRLVDAFMKKNKLSGKVLKKALHESERINIYIYNHAINLFGPDMVNNDYELTKSCLEYPEDLYINSYNYNPIKDNFSGIEHQRMFKTFKSLILNKETNLSTFEDHIRFNLKLKNYGESIKWKSECIGPEFQEEHLDWSNKISEYETGFYERIYPEILEKISFIDIKHNDVVYKPVLLKNSNDYNEESFVQSNCVKGYITTANAIIFSLRKGDSNERCTIEYRLFKTAENDNIYSKNVQSRIRFNQNPTEDWEFVISELDKLVNTSVNNKSFENVKIKKTCKNKCVLQTISEWKESQLKWKKDDIVNYNNYYLW